MIYSIEQQLNQIEKRCEACLYMSVVSVALSALAVALPFGIWGMCG